jgi:hypothetical protein
MHRLADAETVHRHQPPAETVTRYHTTRVPGLGAVLITVLVGGFCYLAFVACLVTTADDHLNPTTPTTPTATAAGDTAGQP